MKPWYVNTIDYQVSDQQLNRWFFPVGSFTRESIIRFCNGNGYTLIHG